MITFYVKLIQIAWLFKISFICKFINNWFKINVFFVFIKFVFCYLLSCWTCKWLIAYHWTDIILSLYFTVFIKYSWLGQKTPFNQTVNLVSLKKSFWFKTWSEFSLFEKPLSYLHAVCIEVLGLETKLPVILVWVD